MLAHFELPLRTSLYINTDNVTYLYENVPNETDVHFISGETVHLDILPEDVA